MRAATPLIACAALTLGACASVPAPHEQVAKAEAQVDTARRHGADQHAPLALRTAEDLLAESRRQLDEEHHLEARRAAEKAEVAALLATTQARREQLQQSVEDLSDTVEALEEELGRAPARSVAPAPGVAPAQEEIAP
jgi:hypothetical protein